MQLNVDGMEPAEPSEPVRRQKIRALMPELKKLRGHGFSFSELAELLEKINIQIKSHELREVFSVLLLEEQLEIVKRTDEQIELLREIKILTSEHKPAAPKAPDDKKASPAPADITPPAAVSTGKREMRCKPFHPGIKPLARRPEVDAAVYDNDELMEHPAIPGLMLSKEERVCGAYLEYFDGDGMLKIETLQEKRFRIKWQKPIPMTPSRTSGDFVEIDHSLFGKRKP